MNKRVFKKAKFYICADSNESIFEGYTEGDRWNGWACPYFTKEVGMEILEKNFNSEYYYGFYNEEHDAFIFNMEDDVKYTIEDLKEDFDLCKELCEKYGYVDIFEGQDIMYNGNPIHVYPIGAYGWIWDEDTEEEEMLF